MSSLNKVNKAVDIDSSLHPHLEDDEGISRNQISSDVEIEDETWRRMFENRNMETVVIDDDGIKKGIERKTDNMGESMTNQDGENEAFSEDGDYEDDQYDDESYEDEEYYEEDKDECFDSESFEYEDSIPPQDNDASQLPDGDHQELRGDFNDSVETNRNKLPVSNDGWFSYNEWNEQQHNFIQRSEERDKSITYESNQIPSPINKDAQKTKPKEAVSETEVSPLFDKSPIPSPEIIDVCESSLNYQNNLNDAENGRSHNETSQKQDIGFIPYPFSMPKAEVSKYKNKNPFRKVPHHERIGNGGSYMRLEQQQKYENGNEKADNFPSSQKGFSRFVRKRKLVRCELIIITIIIYGGITVFFNRIVEVSGIVTAKLRGTRERSSDDWNKLKFDNRYNMMPLPPFYSNEKNDPIASSFMMHTQNGNKESNMLETSFPRSGDIGYLQQQVQQPPNLNVNPWIYSQWNVAAIQNQQQSNEYEQRQQGVAYPYQQQMDNSEGANQEQQSPQLLTVQDRSDLNVNANQWDMDKIGDDMVRPMSNMINLEQEYNERKKEDGSYLSISKRQEQGESQQQSFEPIQSTQSQTLVQEPVYQEVIDEKPEDEVSEDLMKEILQEVQKEEALHLHKTKLKVGKDEKYEKEIVKVVTTQTSEKEIDNKTKELNQKNVINKEKTSVVAVPEEEYETLEFSDVKNEDVLSVPEREEEDVEGPKALMQHEKKEDFLSIPERDEALETPEITLQYETKEEFKSNERLYIPLPEGSTSTFPNELRNIFESEDEEGDIPFFWLMPPTDRGVQRSTTMIIDECFDLTRAIIDGPSGSHHIAHTSKEKSTKGINDEDVLVSSNLSELKSIFNPTSQLHKRGIMFAFFMHPIDRAISLYEYLHSASSHDATMSSNMVRKMSLLEYARDRMKKKEAGGVLHTAGYGGLSDSTEILLESDYMVRSLAQVPLDVALHGGHVAHAIQVVRNYCLVGLTETKDMIVESWNRAQKLFSWTEKDEDHSCMQAVLPPDLQNQQKQAQRGKISESSEEYRLLEKLNEYDMKFYKKVVLIFEEQGTHPMFWGAPNV